MQKTTVASRRFSVKKSRSKTRRKMFEISERNKEIELKRKIASEIKSLGGDFDISYNYWHLFPMDMLQDELFKLKNNGKDRDTIFIEKYAERISKAYVKDEKVELDSDSKLSIAFLGVAIVAAIVTFSLKLFGN